MNKKKTKPTTETTKKPAVKTTKGLSIKKETLADLEVQDDDKVKGASPIGGGSTCGRYCSMLNK